MTEGKKEMPEVGLLPAGRRGKIILVCLVVLAVLAVLTAVFLGNDGDTEEPIAAPASSDTTVAPAELVTDESVARMLLPTVASLGAGWVEGAREGDPIEATAEPGDPCPRGPVPEGLIVRSEQQHLAGGSIVESLAVTAGVVAEGVEPAALSDPVVLECLQAGLAAAVPEGNEVVPVEQPPLTAPEGAEVSGARFEVHSSEETTGTFDFVLVRRGRVVSLGLLAGFDPDNATELAVVVVALDAPVAGGEARLAD